MGADYQKKFEKDYQALWDKLNSVTAENKLIINKVKDQKMLKDKVDDVLAENKILISKVNELTGEIKILKAENAKLHGEVSRLKNQINKDSSNSGKPPSSNGFKKVVQNNREKSTKKRGGQKGHKGSTLTPVKNPDIIIIHKQEKCDCGHSLEYKDCKSKQVFNIKVVTEVTEHKYYDGVCPKCKKIHRQTMPKELSNPANYGASIKSFITFLNNQGVVSIDRSSEFLELITKGLVKVSNGTVCNWNSELANKLNPVIESIKEKLLNSEVLHTDESPIKVDGKQMYVHNASTDKYTLQVAHQKRGLEALEDIGLLKGYCGTIVSDHFLAYYRYGLANAECNVHIARYLKNISTITTHKWADNLLDFFHDTKKHKEDIVSAGYSSFDALELAAIAAKYDDILNLAESEHKEANYKSREPKSLILCESLCLFT